MTLFVKKKLDVIGIWNLIFNTKNSVVSLNLFDDYKLLTCEHNDCNFSEVVVILVNQNHL